MEDDAVKIKFINITAEELDMLSELLVSVIEDISNIKEAIP